MTEHQQLKEICERIGYTRYTDINRNILPDRVIKVNHWKDSEYCEVDIEVREIIFTQEFKIKLSDYLAKQPPEVVKELRKGKSIYNGDFIDYVSLRLGENLDNPVSYLYNLLELGQEKIK